MFACVPEQQSHFAMKSSVEKSYLEGALLAVHACHFKIDNDVALVDVTVPIMKALLTVNDVSLSVLDRLRLIGISLTLINPD